MYIIRPRNLYIHERVLDKPACVARMERMMACIHPDEPPQVVGDAALNEVSHEKQWDRVRTWRTGQYHRQRDPDLIFNAHTWAEPAEIAEGEAVAVGTDRLRAATNQRYPHLAFSLLNGTGMVGYRDGRSLLAKKRGVCQNAHDLHSAWGCLHACDYCNIGEFLNLHLNLEEMVERLDPLLDANPWLQLYKYDNHTDTITFEPEYGASDLLVGYFAGRQSEYLMLYTKSDNVDHLLGLDHRGHTIVSFTISCESVAREIEKRSPDTWARIEAARKCQEAGYHVRVRFSPIIPVRNWREENAQMIEALLTHVRPDVLTMDLLAHFPYERLLKCFDVSLFDAEYLEKIRELYAGEHPGLPYSPAGKQILRHADRAEVYRFFLERMREFDPELPISLCDETPEMWEEFAEDLAGNPEEYVCTCGPTSVPGNPLLRTRAG